MPAMIETSNLHKTHRMGRVRVPVLRGVNLQVERGEWVAILGSSGSGKSTLLHLLGGLDRPDRGGAEKGRIAFEGQSLASLSMRKLDAYRTRRVGFVFQFYHLLPELTALQNVTIAAMVRHGLGYGAKAAAARGRATELLESFGLKHRLAHRPAELSGGERQRVAIARALVNAPDALLADEPTGNLDDATGAAILDVIAEHRERTKQTIVMVTHDTATAARADRVVRLVDGALETDR